MGIAIVAIPEKDDPVWKVSSEKIPHLTLLYMDGPLRNEEQTLQFVQHVAVTSFRKFGLSVDRRDTLGPEDADVLFFENYFTKDLISARSHLLTNTSIAEAYRRAEQYPKWTPHLTLGYPATPAKPNPNDYGIHWVNFDRIAVWFGDYEGPEFRLKSEENMALDTYHADLDNLSDDFLAHFGVRGMKWGVRRKTDSSGLVTGTVDQAIKEGQTPRAGSSSSAPVTKGKKSTDHVKMEENLTKKLEELSTAEIREITNRIKAVNDYKTTTAAEAAKKASVRKKLVDFALNSVQTGAKKAADEYIQEVTGETLKGILPKTKTQQAKDKKQREADEDRAQKKKDREAREAKERSDKAEPAKSREDAVGDLVYVITNMKDKEE